MSQQNLDLRRSLHIARRHKRLIGGVAALGLLIGAGYAFLNPPLLSSTALVVITDSSSPTVNSQAATNGDNGAINTQEVIATSDPVLAGALPNISPSMSLQTLQSRVSVASVDSSSVLSFTAMGKTAGQAEAVANAVANSYIAYVGSATSTAVHAVAKVIEPATTATGTKLPEQIGIYGVLGALAGALAGFVISLSVGRSDRRLVERDAIANSIAAPVLVSLPVTQRPADPASWARMLEEYEPAPVHAYGLSKLLHQLGVGEYGAANGSRANSVSLTVVTLSTDPTALALGPLLAAFASTQGIPTALVVGPQQDTNVTATLRTAAAAAAQSGPGRGKPLHLLVSEDGHLGQLRAPFVVVVSVVDGQDPHIRDTARTSATVLGVSAGGATAEQLARAATAAAVDGREVYGILVANPDPDDQTSGRIPRLTPLGRVQPTRVNGLSTEIRR
ncbi:MAG TPA: Wzz/FepE/Etk N-terminal domain-containing protein [Trebonia sp.]|nr:Wzz/FepE/Etk N-terminal domain-containing protein [Trebonia sp.]